MRGFKMSKDSDDCEVMNELADAGEPLIHWHPIAWYDNDDVKIRDMTEEEKILWFKKHKIKEK